MNFLKYLLLLVVCVISTEAAKVRNGPYCKSTVRGYYFVESNGNEYRSRVSAEGRLALCDYSSRGYNINQIASFVNFYNTNYKKFCIDIQYDIDPCVSK